MKCAGAYLVSHKILNVKKIMALWCLLTACYGVDAQNVGIGTTNPQSRLQVVGRILADSLSLGNVTPRAQLHTTGTVLHQNLANPGGALVYADSIGQLTTNLYKGKMFAMTNDFPGNIPDNSCSGLGRAMSVGNITGTVASKDIAVKLSINHSRNADLTVLLVAPNGKILTLLNANGGLGQNFVNCILTDNATGPLPTGNTSNISGKFKPAGSTTTVCGLTPNATTFEELGTGGQIAAGGTWQIRVFDRTDGNSGVYVGGEISNLGNAVFPNQFFVPRWQFGRLTDSSTIYDNGNVGIGTTTPSQRLDVNGRSVNKNTSCVIHTSGWTATATGTGYAAGTYFAPTAITDNGIAGDTRLINQGGEYDNNTGDSVTTGQFYAPASGFYTVSFRIKAINPGRLLMAASLNGAAPEEILDEFISGNCTPCDDRVYSTIIYMQKGDTHRVLRHVSGVNFAALVISYRLQG
jgi:Proprotein convertase P-domain